MISTVRRRRLTRLRHMGLGELVERSRQELHKRLERLGTNGRMPAAVAAGSGIATGLEARRLFGAASSEGLARLLALRFPQDRDRLLTEAEQVLRGRFDLLGYRGLCFGDPIDWQLDPVSGRRSPLAHWSRIDPLDVTQVGDSKVTWELNRHQWFVTLGQAFRATGDERFAEAFVLHLRAWMRANPPGLGINWASSLEAALRIVSWSWALHLFHGAVALTPGLVREAIASIARHAAHVERYLSRYFSPNTHLTGEALGLVYAGTLLPELPGAERWRGTGGRILVEELVRQVHADGVYFEQSTGYQRYTVEIGLHFVLLSARAGRPAPREVRTQIQRMLDFLLAVRRPDGGVPQIGDADGGWLLPVARRRPDDLRGLFAMAAVLFGRADYAWAAEGAAPETLWLLGPGGPAAFDAVAPAPPRTSPSRLFRDGGYAVMRSDWADGALHLIFDVGPLGCPVSGGHGHADLLGIQCAALGEPYVIDPGTGTYADPAWRSFFRGTAAHATVTVDGQGQAIPAGPFAWGERPRARLRRWISTEAYDLADAEHDAYVRLPDPVRHRRRVLFVKPRYFVILDDLDGGAEHRVEVRFPLASLETAVEPDGWARVRSAGGSGLLVRSFATVPLAAELREGRTDPIEGWCAPDYGCRRPAPVLVYSAEAAFPLRVLTILLPTRRVLDPPPSVSTVADEWGPSGLVFHGGETLAFVEQGVVLTRGERAGVPVS